MDLEGRKEAEREDGPLAWYVAKAFQYCEYQWNENVENIFLHSP